MPHTEAIGREVARLESKANDIESDVAQLIDEIETRVGHEDMSMGTYYFTLFKPNSSQETRLRKIEADYEIWYNAASELVSIYLHNRLTDFENCYKAPFGLSVALKLPLTTPSKSIDPDAKLAVLKKIKNMLNLQKNIVSSIPNVLDIRSLDMLTVISSDLVNSEIGCADYVFKKDKAHDYCLRVAGILAGIALERHLKTRCESELGSLPEKPTLSPLINALYKANKITLNQKQYLEAIATTRNNCAHATASVDRTMVGEAISNVKKLLEGNL